MPYFSRARLRIGKGPAPSAAGGAAAPIGAAVVEAGAGRYVPRLTAGTVLR